MTVPVMGAAAVGGVRPNSTTFADHGVAGEVHIVEERGPDSFVHVHVPGLERNQGPAVRVTVNRPPVRGENVRLRFSGPLHVHSHAMGNALTTEPATR